MRLVIRADGNQRIGMGHVMRMLALAEDVRGRGGEATMAAVRIDEGLLSRARAVGVGVEQGDLDAGTDEDASWLAALARARGADWVVVDGYGFDHRYQAALAAAGLRVVLVDDFGRCERYDADVVLNQNAFATEAMYERRRPGTRLLLGPRYALLRREFATAAADRPTRVDARATRVLVTLGGADPEDAAVRVLDALALVPGDDLRVKVVSGPSNAHQGRRLVHASDPRVEMLPAARDMIPLMTWADLAITGAGSTVYELCCLGVPTLVVAITSAQIEPSRSLDRAGLAVDLGWHAAMDVASAARTIAAVCDDSARRTDLARLGPDLVDGHGASRVVEALAVA
jgi:UDP-2,4-diacetamido-2,4,6-trideoxy-beta-L-altropyranose hydrolase